MSFLPDQYELLDFGDGRKLERFGSYLLDRPCPGAQGRQKSSLNDWSQATSRYERDRGQHGLWRPPFTLEQEWIIRYGKLGFQIKPNCFGHVGIFAEQSDNWDWISQQVRLQPQPIRLLHLFAYTGGSTLAAASAGAQVVHVDAASNIVSRGRANAHYSGLEDAAIRWIVEDVPKFVGRELKRGNRYHGVILDPPSYGHGPKGEVWKLTAGLSSLLDSCGKLTVGQLALVLVTCHTRCMEPESLASQVADSFFWGDTSCVETGRLQLISRYRQRLNCGVFARWSS